MSQRETNERDPRIFAIPDIHGHAKGEHKPYAEERPLPLSARMLFLWFFHACRRGFPRFLMVADHMNYLTFEDPAAVNLVRRALKLAQAGDLYGAAETANVDVGHAAVVSEGLRRGMRYSIGAEVDNDPRSRPDAQNIVDAMRPDGLVRSIHFLTIDHPVHGAGWNWPFDNPEFASLYEHVGTEKTWELYIAAMVDAIERLPGNIIGHFYVPAKFGHWPDDATLEGYEDRVIDALAERGMAIEFNTRFLYREHSPEEREKYLAANRRLLRKARDKNVGIAIGSDAHSPKDQGNSFDVVLEVLDELEINELVFPIGGRLLRVALRAVKEPEPPPAPVPEPPVDAEPAAEVAKPVRKARAAASSSRPKDTAPDRPETERGVPPGTDTDAAPADDLAASADVPPPAKPPKPPRSRSRAKAPAADAPAPEGSPETSETPEVDTVAAIAAEPQQLVAEPEAVPPAMEAPVPPVAVVPKASRTKPPAPQASPGNAAAHKSAVAKAVPVKAEPPKAAPAKSPAKAAKPVAGKRAPAKAVTAKSTAKSTPAKVAAKVAPAKGRAAAKPPSRLTRKPLAAKPAAKAAKPTRTAAKKAAPLRKPAAKAPARAAATKKAAPKKAVAKKTAAKAPARKAAAVKRPGRAVAKSAPLKKSAKKPVTKKAPVKKSATKRR